MGALSGIYILLMVFIIGGHSFSPRIFNPFPLGTIGCLDSDVCESGYICTDDFAFGTCQNIFSSSINGKNTFQLSRNDISALEDEIARLSNAGFTWKDALTQCTLQNMLIELREGRMFKRYFCEEALNQEPQSFTEDTDSPNGRVFVKLLEPGDIPLDNILVQASDTESDADLFNNNKRDEIIQIHKYFDESRGQHKRDPYLVDAASVYQNADLSRHRLHRPRNIFLEQVKENDNNPFINNNEDRYEVSNPNPLTSVFLNSAQIPSLNKNKYNRLQNSIEEQDNKGMPGVNSVVDKLVLASEDEEILGLLLEGKISPGDLDIGTQKRLQIFTKALIQILENNDRNNELMSEGDKAVPSEDTNSVDEHERITKNKDQPVIVYPAHLVRNVNNLRSDEISTETFSNRNIPKDETSISEDGDSMRISSRESHGLNVQSAYLMLSKEVNKAAAELFVHKLIEILKLPVSLLDLSRVGPGHIISLEIRTDLLGKWDAEKIIKEAQNVNSQLEKSTGLTIIDAGVGRYVNRVELKQDNRYVVLTFTLVGAIAGAMLSTLTFFLVKRHARYRYQLSPVTNSTSCKDTTNDYQDLCRQRMLGKSPEKTEPLHTTSGIGNASDPKDRSPSSHGSSSSWSEEPAAGNMDIFTGHIVLSYMEDHLKNQDRLEHEWEAVVTYVPDPASTKVASEQSHMRKNRFADIIPYDHSRVILSSNTNVSNSDYINASFITDHDPRNPAYICTQGPLPHTVADFWQMVWEQGTVMIIMLTRLVENGSALCHRYWPEEGSDLYHIYEVHLVSEHIWCDDYLVRSFYLKNLQTGETRTVTQFHYLTWPDLSVPASVKTLLDFRRKVNKSFRSRSCPTVITCSDGSGRSGTYCLIDMVLNKMAKGAKEIDMAATLEHIRDQRMSLVRTKEQFQFSLAAVAEEVHAILKALPQ